MHHLGAPLLFPIVFGLFDLLLLWGVLELWFSGRRVEVARRELSFSGSLLGLGRRRTVSAEEIAGFKVIRECRPEITFTTASNCPFQTGTGISWPASSIVSIWRST